LGGREDRSKPCRPRPERLQAPYAHLRRGHPARALAQPRERQRHRRAAPARGCDSARARQARASPAPTSPAARRRRLPLAPPPSGAARPWDRRLHPATQTAARIGPRHRALGGRAHDRLAAPVPPSARPPRTTRRHPRGVSPDRRLPDLPQAPRRRGVILLGALSLQHSNVGHAIASLEVLTQGERADGGDERAAEAHQEVGLSRTRGCDEARTDEHRA
jgi:hypothetical protein